MVEGWGKAAARISPKFLLFGTRQNVSYVCTCK
jgi:hypothetical protein